jgi:hypothetical protein
MNSFRSLVMQLLLMVQSLPHIVDPTRQRVAGEVLDANLCCLKARFLTDCPSKLRILFAAEFQVARVTGTCPIKLYKALLVVRSRWSIDTQDVEGYNSVLQAICNAAPNIKHALVSDRLRAKLGDPISPTECCDMHGSVVALMNSEAHVQRFSGDIVAAPSEYVPKTCEHLQVDVAVYRFQLGVKSRSSLSPFFVHSFQVGLRLRTVTRDGFVMCWSYYSKVYLISELLGGPTCFKSWFARQPNLVVGLLWSGSG